MFKLLTGLIPNANLTYPNLIKTIIIFNLIQLYSFQYRDIRYRIIEEKEKKWTHTLKQNTNLKRY